MHPHEQSIRVHPTALVGEGSQLGQGVIVGAYATIGLLEGVAPDLPAPRIGDRCVIGHHCVIERGAVLETDVQLDPYSRVANAFIGNGTRLLYGARVHEDVAIGQDCRIAGNCPDRTVIGDCVTHLGKIAHGGYWPFLDWDEPKEVAPVIGSRVLIATDALLIGPIRIGSNVFIFPREIVRQDVPDDGIFRNGAFYRMPGWPRYLGVVGMVKEGWRK